jgi:hypothetical protein
MASDSNDNGEMPSDDPLSTIDGLDTAAQSIAYKPTVNEQSVPGNPDADTNINEGGLEDVTLVLTGIANGRDIPTWIAAAKSYLLAVQGGG